jgi:hypothetical protein
MRHAENQMVVVHGQQFALPRRQPLVPSAGLAFGAVTISAGVDWTPKDKERMRGLRSSASQYTSLRLGDFKALVTNWQKFSALARRDPNFVGLLDAFHVQYAVGSVPSEDIIYLAEWK